MGVCCIMTEQLRMEIAELAFWYVDRVNAMMCQLHIRALKEMGDGRGAFNMLLHYEIEHPDWFPYHV